MSVKDFMFSVGGVLTGASKAALVRNDVAEEIEGLKWFMIANCWRISEAHFYESYIIVTENSDYRTN